MNPALYSSPASTQITYAEYPVELNECRDYLEGLGMSPAEADELLSSNRRESFFVDNADFVNIMEQLIRTGKYGQMRHYDIHALKSEWQSRNKALETQFGAVQTRILLDSLDYLSAIKHEHAVKNMLEFVRSGASNYHINFVIHVLPLLLNNPTSKPTHQHPTTKDSRTTNARQTQKTCPEIKSSTIEHDNSKECAHPRTPRTPSEGFEKAYITPAESPSEQKETSSPEIMITETAITSRNAFY